MAVPAVSSTDRPALFVFDEDVAARGEVERELSARYASHYDVCSASSADEASSRLRALAADQVEVALVLVGAWWPGEAGSVVLDEAARHHAHAQRVALIDWNEWGQKAVGSGIFEGISDGRFDHYVMRPTLSPDERFHETVSSMLLDWSEANRAAPYTVHIVADSWTGRGQELREALKQCAVVHNFCLADSVEGQALVAGAKDGIQLPLVVLPDGSMLENPTNAEMAEHSGGPAYPQGTEFDVVIVGAGPAGLSAAVYGASEGFSTLVVDQGGIGGQATSSSLIRNYMGFPRGISGRRLALNAYSQAWVFGADFAFMQAATDITREDDHLVVTLADWGQVRADAVLLATGASYRRMGVPSLECLLGAGVYYGGSTAEAPTLVGRDVFIVGGANSAGQAALHLARYAKRVTLLIRGESLRAGMSDYLVRQIEASTNIDVRLRCEVSDGGGDGKLEFLVLRETDRGVETRAEAQALFIFIGARPNTRWLPADVECDDQGFILTGSDLTPGAWPEDHRQPQPLETSMPGVFAVGDVRHGGVRRVASAAGSGSIAVQHLHQHFAAEQRQPRGRPQTQPV